MGGLNGMIPVGIPQNLPQQQYQGSEQNASQEQ